MFAELHVTTSFTFLTGASQPEELVHRALALGYSALAITDECSLAGVVRAWQAARDTPLHLIIGSRVRLTGEPAPQVILLAPDNFAYANLCQLITLARRDSDKGQYRVTPDMLAAHSAHLLCLWLPG